MKRLCYLNRPNQQNSPSMTGRQPDVAPNQIATEKQHIEQRLEGQDATAGRAAVEGKVKQILDQITAIQSKVNTLGRGLKLELDNYLDTQTGTDVDINSAESAQQKVKEWIGRLDARNMEVLRNFDKGLDLVMLRVEFRKQMAQTLEGLGTGEGALTEQQKQAFGTFFEMQLTYKEKGKIDTSEVPREKDFKDVLSVMHSFTKYAKMMKEIKAKGAGSLSAAITIPEHGVAYPPTGRNGFIFFKYWIENVDGAPQLHCIDNNGAVQRMNPFTTDEFRENPWTVVYNPYTKQKHSSLNYSATEINRYKPRTSDITPEQRRQMLENFAYERTFISAESRGVKDFPQNELRDLEAIIMQKFRTLEQNWKEGYERNPGNNSANYPLVQTYQFTQSNEYKQQVRDVMTRMPTLTNALRHNVPARPARRPRRAPRRRPVANPERPTGAERAPEARESTLRLNEILESPTDGKIALKGIEVNGHSPVEIARLKSPSTLKQRTVQAVLVNDRPAPLNTISITDGGILLNNKAVSDENITVICNDELKNGTNKTERVRISFTEHTRLSAENVQSFVELQQSSIRKGGVDTNGTQSYELARFVPKNPNIVRDIKSATINGEPAFVLVVGNKLVLRFKDNSNNPQKFTSPADVRIVMDVIDNTGVAAGTPPPRLPAAINFRIENPPAPDQKSLEISRPQDGNIYLGVQENSQFSEEVIVANLADYRANNEYQLMDPAHPQQEHPFLELDGSTIVVKQNTPLNVPAGDVSFLLRTRAKNSTSNWAEKTITLNNQQYPNNLQEQLGDSVNLPYGKLESNGEVFLKMPILPAGIQKREVAEVSFVDKNNQMTQLDTSHFFFHSVSGGLVYQGGNELPEGTLTIKLAYFDGAHQPASNLEEIRVNIRPAQAPTQNDIQLRGGDQLNGVTRKRVKSGVLRAGTTAVETGAHLEVGNLNANVSIAEVHSGSQSGQELLTSDHKAPLEIDPIGNIVLKPGQQLPVGTFYLRLNAERNGANNRDIWIVIENQDFEPAAREDAELAIDTVRTGILDTQSGGTPDKLEFAQLLPARAEVTERKLISATIGNVVYHQVKMDADGKIYLDNRAIVPTGEMKLQFEVTVKGQSPRKIPPVTLKIQEKPDANLKHEHEMSMEGTNETERENVRIGQALEAIYQNTTLWKNITDQLQNFHEGRNVQTVNLVAIDAKTGRYAVNNDGFTTELFIVNHQVVLRGGAPGKEAEMRFGIDSPALSKALLYATAMNRMFDEVLVDMSLNERSKFNPEGQTGKYFVSDGLSTVEANDGQMYETDIWNHNFPDAQTKDAFLNLANARMSDILGTTGTNAITARPLNDANSLPPIAYEGLSGVEYVQGEVLNFTLKNLSKDSIYSYSGDRDHWYQLKNTEGDVSVTLQPDHLDSNTIIRGGKKYVRLMLSVSPKNASDRSKRPRIVEVELPLRTRYRTERTGRNTLESKTSIATLPNFSYDLTQGVKEGRNANEEWAPGHSLSIAENPDAEGNVIIQNNNQPFARVSSNQKTGIIEVSYINSADANKYRVRIDQRVRDTKGAITFTRTA